MQEETQAPRHRPGEGVLQRCQLLQGVAERAQCSTLPLGTTCLSCCDTEQLCRKDTAGRTQLPMPSLTACLWASGYPLEHIQCPTCSLMKALSE